MKPLGEIGIYDCTTCQALCCVASGRKGLPDKLSLATSHPCPNISIVGDCVSCSVHDTLTGNPAMKTCHLFDCRGLGNRFSDIMKKSGVHWMKDVPLSPEKQVVFENVIYYFDLIGNVLSFLARVQQAGLSTAHGAGVEYVMSTLDTIESDCQRGVSSKERLVDFWMVIISLVRKLPPQFSQGFNIIENTNTLQDAITQNVFMTVDQMQAGLSHELGPELREYAFAYATITLVEVAIHGKKFEESFHHRAVNQVCKNIPPEAQALYRALLNNVYRPLTLGFGN